MIMCRKPHCWKLTEYETSSGTEVFSYQLKNGDPKDLEDLQIYSLITRIVESTGELSIRFKGT